MKKIVNWTFGSFFRTIGRTLAFILFGFLIAMLFSKLNIKIPFMSAKALSMPNKYKSLSDLYENYTTCSLQGDNTIINLPNSANLKKYYFIYNDLYNNTLSQNIFYIFTDDEPFYIVVQEYPNSNGNRYYINSYKKKEEISEETYNNYKNNSLYKYRVYYDQNDNKYYLFSVYNLNQYRIDTTWTQIATDSYATRVYSQNINELYFYSQSLGSNMRKNNNSCFSSANELISYNVTFHLNNGKICDSSSGGGSSGGGHGGIGCHYEDFTKTFYESQELLDYATNANVTKTGETFVGWYEDINLTTQYAFGSPLDSDRDLYAKYVFSDVNKLISEVNFTEYTFPNDKNFAVIYNTGYFETYLGFQKDFYNIGVYNYNFNDNIFSTYSNYYILPIGKVGNYYYYDTPLNPTTSEIKYIVLSKSLLTALNDEGVMTEYFTFKVSDNAVVTFYSDLSNITLEDSNGNSYTGDASQIYWNTQNDINNNSDLVGIFNNIAKNKNGNILKQFSNIWYKFRSTPIFNYFNIMIIGAFIIFILKVASRK